MLDGEDPADFDPPCGPSPDDYPGPVTAATILVGAAITAVLWCITFGPPF